ncbi:MAG: translation initiation factor IF-2 N-terminal domain-containing protein, partial [Candidatus Caldatribacteriaceae bacterium]
MTKVRIYKVAETLGIPTYEVIEMLRELGVEVKNHMSSIDEDLVELLQEEISYRRQQEEEIRKRKEKTLLFENLPTLKEIAKILLEEPEDVILR